MLKASVNKVMKITEERGTTIVDLTMDEMVLEERTSPAPTMAPIEAFSQLAAIESVSSGESGTPLRISRKRHHSPRTPTNLTFPVRLQTLTSPAQSVGFQAWVSSLHPHLGLDFQIP
ncbi:hypothetical protein ZIOFF_021259 [Zingiber officinale]|uniref:Uncharacterized protein n=1 Tax=Zingiber officinale TaxID=94328 RepID=A0A8J5H839_ZINOF|nr:hypothetical protein ZIOFF_021259 [Zingiber officinale]